MQNDITENDIIYGKNPVFEALSAGSALNKVVFSKTLHRDGTIQKIVDLCGTHKVPYSWVAPDILDKMAGTNKNQGIVAWRAAFQYCELEDILSRAKQTNQAPFMLLLDGVEDPHNLGALIRTAETAGMHGIVITKHRACGITPIVAKTSAGALEHMLVHRCTNLNQCIEDLKKANIWVIGVESHAQQLYTQANLKGPLALVLGSEGAGIARLVQKNCDSVIRIPVKGKVNSLNVSAAGAVVIYEAVRQRG